MTTMKVQPWGQGQGNFVIIDADKFDPSFHVAIDDAPAAPPANDDAPASVTGLTKTPSRTKKKE